MMILDVLNPKVDKRRNLLSRMANHTEQGAKVTAQYNTNGSALKPLCEKYSELRAVHGDVTSESDISKLFIEINSDRPAQVVVLNHGLWPTADIQLADMSLEQWNLTIATNLTSNFLLARGYLNGLKSLNDDYRSKAAIVMVGSTAGKYGEAGHSDYASAKSGE
jgi:NAD(P)-dependent dehydrogenase (short-subunit alcohol dehydrogenase family)